MRRIFINEEQDKLIRTQISPIVDLLRKRVGDGDIYVPLNNCDFAEKLVNDGYKKAVGYFSDNITEVPKEQLVNEFNRILASCIKKEQSHRAELEKLCYNIIVEAFDIPTDTIGFVLDLEDEISGAHEFHITPSTGEDKEYDSVESINIETKEVEKKKLINILIQGIADKLSNELIRKHTSEIFDMDEELPHMYSKLVKLNNFILLSTDIQITDKEHHQGAYVETTIRSDMQPSKIVAKGICFPFLLTEAIKGVIEVIAANGLPDNVETAKVVIDKADCLEQEPWNMRMGISFWDRLSNGKDIEPSILPYFLDYLVRADADSFISLIDEVIHNTKKGKTIVNNIIKAVKHDAEYNKFANDIMQKDTEKPLIDEIEFSF